MFLNRYEVIDEERIQQGGQAKVFACIDTETEDRVAVKTTALENPQNAIISTRSKSTLTIG